MVGALVAAVSLAEYLAVALYSSALPALSLLAAFNIF